jgi:hypothetical protein
VSPWAAHSDPHQHDHRQGADDPPDEVQQDGADDDGGEEPPECPVSWLTFKKGCSSSYFIDLAVKSQVHGLLDNKSARNASACRQHYRPLL